jgi:hypothetical protein
LGSGAVVISAKDYKIGCTTSPRQHTACAMTLRAQAYRPIEQWKGTLFQHESFIPANSDSLVRYRVLASFGFDLGTERGLIRNGEDWPLEGNE